MDQLHYEPKLVPINHSTLGVGVQVYLHRFVAKINPAVTVMQPVEGHFVVQYLK